MSGHQDQRRQSAVGQDQALSQPGSPGTEDGGDEPVAQQFGPRCLLPPTVQKDGQAQRQHCDGAQARANGVFLMLTRGEDFVDKGQQLYEEQQRQRSVAALKRRAAALGFEIKPIAVPA